MHAGEAMNVPDCCQNAQTASAMRDEADASVKIVVQGLNAWYERRQVLFDIHLRIPDRQITAIIGPSGSGKSTLLRVFNRLHETVRHARVEGVVLLDGLNIFTLDPRSLRQRVGMVFQMPNPFPKSIFDNIAFGLRINGMRDHLAERVERSLRRAALWEEVKDRLHRPATELSGGQQQRLCIARALALEPEVLLLDEPCSALDPVSTARIEELLIALKDTCTPVLVTHQMQQAARVSDFCYLLLDGRVIEGQPTRQLFTTPRDPRTEAYLTGRYG
jgi:phosphate transport system ATP-binding protein